MLTADRKFFRDSKSPTSSSIIPLYSVILITYCTFPVLKIKDIAKIKHLKYLNCDKGAQRSVIANGFTTRDENHQAGNGINCKHESLLGNKKDLKLSKQNTFKLSSTRIKKFQFRMWPCDSIDLKNADLVLNHQQVIKTDPRSELNPYKFTKLENGKRTTADSSSLTVPRWLLLDHSIAVIWSMFNLNSAFQLLSIDDLKWAYEFLRRIKNKKGENPPDVKVCLKKIQDRLINLYAKLTSLKEGVDLDEFSTSFDEKIKVDSTSSYLNNAITENKVESKFDTVSLSPCKNSLALTPKHSAGDILKTGNAKKMVGLAIGGLFSISEPTSCCDFDSFLNSSKKPYSFLQNSDTYDGAEAGAAEDDEVEKYVFSFFKDEKKEFTNTKTSTKSLIPTKKKTDAASTQETNCELTKKKGQASKRVHCVAEMRSLKFQKSMKVKDTNGEEAAYSNLKAEIQRLTINPKVSRNEVMKFLKDWRRSEQVDRLHNELKRLSSIEEFMKNLNNDEVEANLRMNSHFGLTELDT